MLKTTNDINFILTPRAVTSTLTLPAGETFVEVACPHQAESLPSGGTQGGGLRYEFEV